MAKTRCNFLIDRATYAAFSQTCETEGLIRSKRLELCLQEFVKNKGKTKHLPTAKTNGQRLRYNFNLPTQLYTDFCNLCDEVGLVRSKVVERHIIQFVNTYEAQ